MAKFADVEVQEVDDEWAWADGKPTHLAIFEDGLIALFNNEDAACAFQRTWRAAIGLNPMTGEKA